MNFRFLKLTSLIVLWIVSSSGCIIFRKSVTSYKETKLPESQAVYDIPYWSSPEADPVKNRLDLFLPQGQDWPLLVFVHGGEWISGDKSLKVMGSEIYRNIGRYFASQGVGTAIINYRLIPQTDWKSQIMDVARAVTWLHANIKNYHGNPQQIFVMGHSSGAQLAARIALDPKFLKSLNASPSMLCGIIPVSGAGYDLTDEETYALAQKDDLFEKLFHKGDIPASLRRQLSPQKFVNSKAPPFLVMYSEKEEKELQKGSIRLNDELNKVGASSQIIEIYGEDHKSVVLSLSNPQMVPTNAILVFLRTLHCTGT